MSLQGSRQPAAPPPPWRGGGARLCKEIVAVVPNHDQPEVLNRCEHRLSGADHDADVPTPDGQETDSDEPAQGRM